MTLCRHTAHFGFAETASAGGSMACGSRSAVRNAGQVGKTRERVLPGEGTGAPGETDSACSTERYAHHTAASPRSPVRMRRAFSTGDT